MKNTPIESLKPFTEPGDWRTMMATMVEPALRAQIAAQSQVMNEAWMGLIADGGLLRLPEICKTDHKDISAFIDGVDQWTQRLTDFTRFTAESTMTNFGAEDGEDIFVLINGGPKGVQEVYTRATADVLSDYRSLLAHPLADKNDTVADSANTMALWLAGAIALDLPDSVTEVVKAVPWVADAPVPLTALRADLGEYLLHQETNDGIRREGDLSATLTAQGVALFLSREACLDALWSSGISPLTKLGDHTTTDSVSNGADGPSVHTTEFFADDMPRHIVPVCTPDAWEKTIKKLLDDPGFDIGRRENLYALAINELVTDERPWMAAYVPALINANVYHSDPMNTLRVSAGVGALQVLESVLPSVKWEWPLADHVFSGRNSPLVKATGGTGYGNSDEREACVLKVMDAAVEAGRLDLVTSKFVEDESTGGTYLVPLFDFAIAGFNHAVLKSIENGWDPKSNPPGCEGLPTLIDYCDEMAPEVAHAIRTSAARAKAFSALDSIEKPAPRQGAR